MDDTKNTTSKEEFGTENVYFFPSKGINIKAKSLEEAQAKFLEMTKQKESSTAL